MTEAGRPNPDQLLARLAEESRRHNCGRLKVFFGAAPGVGKTYAMLEAAHRARDEGRNVLLGVVETHHRRETEALLEGLPVLPRRKSAYRGIEVAEFDLDAALARHPDLILVDELAHTNGPDSRHTRRWQDVRELLDAGIDVYTTLNVQHLESVNDVVAQITGVHVQERIPDAILEEADEIELVDLPVDELLRRLEAGRVYFPEQAAQALQNFFRPGNLIALREMALRRTAERVDAQMRSYRSDNAIQSTWPVATRLMVSIGPSPFAPRLIRAAKRMAERLGAEWIVAFVETPEYAAAPAETRERVLFALRLAGQMGAETVTLAGANVAETLLLYARSRNVSRIVAGKYSGAWWKRILRVSVLDELIAQSGDIEVVAISGAAEPTAVVSRRIREKARPPWGSYGRSAAIVAVATVISLALRSLLSPVNLAMFFLVGVVAVAMKSSRQVTLLASLVSVASLDFFCIPPYYTFVVGDSEYLITFAAMVVVGIIISSLTVRARLQAEHAAARESRTQALYRLTRELTAETTVFDAASRATSITREVFGSRVAIFLPDEKGKISLRRRTTEELPVPQSEEAIAQWVFDHGQKAGTGMDTLPGASALYLPLKGSGRTVAVMAALVAGEIPPEQHHLLEIFAAQTALAIERVQAAAEARAAQLRIETEQMRSSLLSAVSHDLRTPLATITGAASSLLSQGRQMPEPTRNDLLESIALEADRLSRLVNNLLDITRLESGAIRLTRNWHPLEEIVGAALTRLETLLHDRPVVTRIPESLPQISVDDVLVEQLFLNILENAARYTPEGSPIQITAHEADGGVRVDVADSGPGFAPGEEKLIWEKFYRGKAQSGRGAGLGLAICKAIVAAHGGRIGAENRPEGGALIRIWLPLGGEPPRIDSEKAPGNA
jgi:two-component system sensor histidine kinase KdpD